MPNTYEKANDNTLKIIETVENTVTMEELIAQKTQIENDLAASESQYNEVRSGRQTRLSEINELISTAEGLGVAVTPPTPEPILEESQPEVGETEEIG